MKANSRKRSKLINTIVYCHCPILPYTAIYCSLLRYRYTELHGKNSHREFHTGSTTKKSNILKLSENLVDRTSREIQNDEV
jgi:hypothetical protein